MYIFNNSILSQASAKGKNYYKKYTCESTCNKSTLGTITKLQGSRQCKNNAFLCKVLPKKCTFEFVMHPWDANVETCSYRSSFMGLLQKFWWLLTSKIMESQDSKQKYVAQSLDYTSTLGGGHQIDKNKIAGSERVSVERSLCGEDKLSVGQHYIYYLFLNEAKSYTLKMFK